MNIKTVNLTKNYMLPHNQEVKVLKGINISVNSGEKIALTGPSGAGKSTLIHILGLMDKPTSGQVLIDGENITNFSSVKLAQMRKKNIGFVFQFHYLLADFNVLENVLMPVWEKKKEKTSEAMNLLETMGLTDRINHFPSELSGGEQQRAALARALINNPKILFADEPTGNLDRETGKIIEKLMFEMCDKRDMTLVVVTHSPELAAKADRSINIMDGTIK